MYVSRGRGSGGGRGRGGRRRGGNPNAQAWDRFLSVSDPERVVSETAERFVRLLEDQVRFRGDVKAVVWRLVDSAAVAERSERLNSTAPAANGAVLSTWLLSQERVPWDRKLTVSLVWLFTLLTQQRCRANFSHVYLSHARMYASP